MSTEVTTPIRYDWPTLRLLYVGGASHTDIAHSIAVDFPQYFERIRDAISQRSSREDWPSLRQAAVNIVLARPDAPSCNDSTIPRVSSEFVSRIASNTRSVRKERYLNSATDFIDRAAEQLDRHKVESLADAALAAKLMQPVHEIARDVHGLSAKDGSSQVQVNILSEWAGGGPPAVEADGGNHNTSQIVNGA